MIVSDFVLHRHIQHALCFTTVFIGILLTHCMAPNTTESGDHNETDEFDLQHHSSSRTYDGCIQLHSKASYFTMACSFCESESGELLNLNHLMKKRIVNIGEFDDALNKNKTIWIDGTDPLCKRKMTDLLDECKFFKLSSFLSNQSCSDNYNFFCYHHVANDSKCGNRSLPEGNTVPSTSTNIPSSRLFAQEPRTTVSEHVPVLVGGLPNEVLTPIAVIVPVWLFVFVVGIILCRRFFFTNHWTPAKIRMQQSDGDTHSNVCESEMEPLGEQIASAKFYDHLGTEEQHDYISFV